MERPEPEAAAGGLQSEFLAVAVRAVPRGEQGAGGGGGVADGEAPGARLTVCPVSAAWATKLRLEQAYVIKAANASAGRTVVLRTSYPRAQVGVRAWS
ncbi:DciA family protein [Streptomyces acidicola]|uniref:DciA family protein n=1 Tax=Streptomyces acidicola TaxID=2596892 RepID=UPI0018846470|nr:DciA family protein [Streptomyces acidicola]